MIMSDSSTPPPISRPSTHAVALPAELRRDVLQKLRHIRGVPPADLEDVAQEATLRAWRSLHTYDERRGSWLDWVGGVVRNTVSDVLRRMRRRPESACEALPDVVADPEPGPDAQVAAAELSALVRRIAAEIPDELRVVFLLKAEGMTVAQIARELGILETTVQGRLARARRRAEEVMARWQAGRRLEPADLLVWVVVSAMLSEGSAEAAPDRLPRNPSERGKRLRQHLRDLLLPACLVAGLVPAAPALPSALRGAAPQEISSLLGAAPSTPITGAASDITAAGGEAVSSGAAISTGALAPLPEAAGTLPSMPERAEQSAGGEAPPAKRAAKPASQRSAQELDAAAAVLASVQQGRAEEAEARAARFERAFPKSVYAARVRLAVAAASAKGGR